MDERVGWTMSSTTPASGLCKQELWYGRPQDPTPRTVLTAGDLTVELEGAEIRSVALGDAELLRNVYMAVRDEEWGTVPGTLSDYEITRGADEFAVSFAMAHSRPPVSFTWRGTIEGDRSGVVSYELDGVAEADFKYCRIGFCLLHPPQCAGRAYRGRSPQGAVEGTLPLEIGPQRFERGVYWPLFESVNELELSIDGETELRLVFEGDLFETEDQRNWTDASFKTYCTPQALGYPFDAHAGEQFHQKITFEVTARPESAGARHATSTGHRVELGSAPGQPLSAIGVALPRAVDRHSDGELALLAAARPDHLRVDLALGDERWAERLAGAAATAERLGCRLEVAAFANGEAALDALVERLAPLAVARLLMFGYEQEMSDPAMTRAVRERIAQRGLKIPVFGGTDLWFAELNRDRPDVSAMDGLVYTITPQVHTFDEQSIAQSLEAQPDTVRTAATFGGGLPLAVSPVTLRPRDVLQLDHFNPTDGAQQMPFSVDPRQSSLFAAAWTVGSIAALAGAGASSLTYYETVGWRGIISGDRQLPEQFIGAPAGGAFAVFQVFADLGELGDETTLVDARSSRPSEVCALALESGQLQRALIANLTPSQVTVEVAGLAAQAAALRVLDERTANDALSDPLGYRARPPAEVSLSGGSVTLDLAPFAIARLDARPMR